MKNKKLLNVYILCLSLLALITFILPLSKTSYESGVPLILNIVYYATNVIMLIALCLIIIISILNLFSDNYDGVKFSHMLALVAFAMVFINLVVYASNWFYAIDYGYILLAVEVFALYIFNHVVKIVYNIKDVKGYVQKYLPAPKENGKAQNVKPAEIKEKSKVSKAANNNVSSKAKQSNDSNIPLSDNNIEVVNNSPEIVTGEKE